MLTILENLIQFVKNITNTKSEFTKNLEYYSRHQNNIESKYNKKYIIVNNQRIKIFSNKLDAIQFQKNYPESLLYYIDKIDDDIKNIKFSSPIFLNIYQYEI